MANDAGGATGGTSFCSISPSDNVGIIENFLHRIEELEKVVSQLSASNILANQLSDLSQQIGWVGGITYMGIEGWTQTEYGTLIPPAGVSLSSLSNWYDSLTNNPCNPYDSDGNLRQELHLSVYDSDGNLNFGTGCGGQLVGTKVDEWDTAAASTGPMDYCDVNYQPPSGNYQTIRGGFTVTASPSTSNGLWRVQVTNAGLYYAHSIYQVFKSGAGSFSAGVNVKTSADNAFNDWQDFRLKADGSGTVSPQSTRIQLLDAGDTVENVCSVLGSGETIRKSALMVVRLSG